MPIIQGVGCPSPIDPGRSQAINPQNMPPLKGIWNGSAYPNVVNLVIYGDSILQDTSTGGTSLSMQMLAFLLGTQVSVTNVAFVGATLDGMISAAAASVDTLLVSTPGVANVILWNGGVYDCQSGADITTIQNRLVAFGTQRQTAGWISVRNGAQPASIWTASIPGVNYSTLTAWERANWPSYCSGFADIAANSVIGAPTAYSDARYYVGTIETMNTAMIKAQQIALPLMTALLGPE